MSWENGFTRRSDVTEDELKNFFGSVEIDHPFEPWETDRWQDRRAELIGDECTHCGSRAQLQVHHTIHGPNWPSLWNECRNDLFFEECYDPERYAPHEGACPNCRNKSYRGRVTKQPAYVCTSCSAKFDTPLQYPRGDASENEMWKAMTKFTEERASDITAEFATRFWNEWEAYFEGDDTVTLCQSCHYKIENRD